MTGVPTIHYKSGYKHQLREHAVEFDCPELARWEYRSRFLSLVKGVMRFEIGYAWDGLSGPKFDTPGSMPGGLGHDGGAEIMRNLELTDEEREAFVEANNAFFHRLLEATDPPKPKWYQLGGQWARFRTWYTWRGVSLVDGYADPSSRKPLLEAP